MIQQESRLKRSLITPVQRNCFASELWAALPEDMRILVTSS